MVRKGLIACCILVKCEPFWRFLNIIKVSGRIRQFATQRLVTEMDSGSFVTSGGQVPPELFSNVVLEFWPQKSEDTFCQPQPKGHSSVSFFDRL